eukprot:Tbor_TRINITY_DN4660_c0_g1::TRINITY_DN4660_c0_g1_i1::g.14809::m.14809
MQHLLLLAQEKSRQSLVASIVANLSSLSLESCLTITKSSSIQISERHRESLRRNIDEGLKMINADLTTSNNYLTTYCSGDTVNDRISHTLEHSSISTGSPLTNIILYTMSCLEALERRESTGSASMAGSSNIHSFGVYCTILSMRRSLKFTQHHRNNVKVKDISPYLNLLDVERNYNNESRQHNRAMFTYCDTAEEALMLASRIADGVETIDIARKSVGSDCGYAVLTGIPFHTLKTLTRKIDYQISSSSVCCSFAKNLLIPTELKEQMCELVSNFDKIMTGGIGMVSSDAIPYWASGGTLLGLVRNPIPTSPLTTEIDICSIIPWDDDVDVCMSIEHEQKLKQRFNFPYGIDGGLILEFNPMFGYKVYSGIRNKSNFPFLGTSESQLFSQYGVFIDIFLMAPSDNICHPEKFPPFPDESKTLELAFPQSRAAWPAEVWKREDVDGALESLPFYSKPIVGCENKLTRISAPSHSSMLQYLNRMYGAKDWEKVGVVPRELHGRHMSHTLYIPLHNRDIG